MKVLKPDSALLLFASFFAPMLDTHVAALQCYQCTVPYTGSSSETAWAKCRQNIRLQTCTPSHDKCGKTNIRLSLAGAVGLSCETSDECTFKPACFTAGVVACNFTCCTGDLCNGIAAPTVRPIGVTTRSPLRCHKCSSTTSWAECDRTKTTMMCDAGHDKCGRAYAYNSEKGAVYVRGCESSDLCKLGCSHPNFRTATKCNVSCCSGDLCNTHVPQSQGTPFTTRSSIFSSGSGLRCYECTSEKSWADCEIQRKIKTCTKGLFCAKGYAKTDSGDRFIKTCETHSECTNKPSCNLPGVDSSTCQVHCCNTDKCNGGVGITFSTSVLLIVILLLLLIW